MLVFTMAGCAARQPSPPTRVSLPDQEASALAERDRLLTSLQTPVIMDYLGPSGNLKAREQLTARRPASLRVEVMSPLGVALIVTADDSEIAVFDPSHNTLMRGEANAVTLEHFTRIPMAPAQAVQLLLSLVPDRSVLTSAPSSDRTEGEMKVLSYAGAGAASYELGFSGGQLAMVRASDAARAIYEVAYSDYRDIGAISFPFAIEARFFASATTVKFHYLNPLIDRQIADSAFVLAPGPGTKLIELRFGPPSTLKPAPG